MMSDELFGWHFSTGRLAHDSTHPRIRTGVTHHVKGPLDLCRTGLHASVHALDALEYAPCVLTGLYVARVRLHGTILRGEDKACATERTYIWVAPADLVLHEFACEVAECALMIGQVEDERSWNAIAVKREWMAGRATNEQLVAAKDAAWDAARGAKAAAWDAARGARVAAWDAAGGTAWDAAGGAAWGAAWDAAGVAAWDAARGAWGAAWDAARVAARVAAGGAAGVAATENDLLESLLNQLAPAGDKE